MRRILDFLWRSVLGQKATSDSGSNSRRLLSRGSIFFVVALTLESFSFLSLMPDYVFYLSRFSVTYSVFFFTYVIVLVPFLSSSTFKLNPSRLFQDAVISIALSVLSFALIYRDLGIKPPDDVALRNSDYIYFSAVTFSTLGYGDFSPLPAARLYAALQALIGNLHLGVVVGAAFLAATRTHSVSGD